MNLNGNKLANIWRDIMNKKRLTDFELGEIKEKVIADVKNMMLGMKVLVVQVVQMQILEKLGQGM